MDRACVLTTARRAVPPRSVNMASERWVPVAHVALEAPMRGTVVAPELDDVFLVTSGPVRRARLAELWSRASSTLEVTECPRLTAYASSLCPVSALGGGRLVVEASREMSVVEADTGVEIARFPSEGRVSPDGRMLASIVTRVTVEHSSSSLDWRSDWTRDGDDLSERRVEHREGVAIRFASGHPGHGETLVLPVRDAYAVRWRGNEGVVAWSNQAIDVCDLATRRPRRLVECAWVISSVDVCRSGRYVVGEPPGRPVTLWGTAGEIASVEVPEVGRTGLLHVTDEGIVTSWKSETREVALFDVPRRRSLPAFSTPEGSVTWAFDAAARRAILVGPTESTLFERR